MFTAFRIQNVSAGRKYFQCKEQEASFKLLSSKVRKFASLTETGIILIKIVSGLVLARMKPCLYVNANLMRLKMVGDLNQIWWRVDSIIAQLLRYTECIYLVRKRENERTAHQDRDKEIRVPWSMDHDRKDCWPSSTDRRKVFVRIIVISDKARQHIVRSTFRQHHKVAQMVDHSILNGLLVQSYPSHFMAFPQLFSMTIYMSLVGFTSIHEGNMLMKQYKAGTFTGKLPVKLCYRWKLPSELIFL